MIMIAATAIALFRFFICKEDPAIEAADSHEPIHVKEILTLFAKNKYIWLYTIIMLCYNIITNLAVGSYYFKYVIGDISMQGMLSVVSIVLLPLMLIFPQIMNKIGSMGKMIFYFCIIGIVGYLICFFSNTNLVGVMVGYVMGQFASLPLAYYMILFIMNICTYNEMLGMQRMEGSSHILSSFASKVGAAMGAWLSATWKTKSRHSTRNAHRLRKVKKQNKRCFLL